MAYPVMAKFDGLLSRFVRVGDQAAFIRIRYHVQGPRLNKAHSEHTHTHTHTVRGTKTKGAGTTDTEAQGCVAWGWVLLGGMDWA